MRLIRVFPLAWLTKYTVFTFPFPDSGSLIWILPSEYSSTDSNNIRPDTTDLFCRNWNYISVLKCIKAVSTVNILKPRRSCSWTYKINKLLVSPNERSNNIILERTIEYINTTRPQNSSAKESNATSEIEAHGKKDRGPHGPLTCSHGSSQVITCLSYGTSLLAVTIVNSYAVT